MVFPVRQLIEPYRRAMSTGEEELLPARELLSAVRTVSSRSYQLPLNAALRTAAEVTRLELLLGEPQDVPPLLVTGREDGKLAVSAFRVPTTAEELEQLIGHLVPMKLIAKQAQVCILSVIIFGPERFQLKWEDGEPIEGEPPETDITTEPFGSSYLVGEDLSGERVAARAALSASGLASYRVLRGEQVERLVPTVIGQALRCIAENCAAN
jgi:hypothetical protein